MDKHSFLRRIQANIRTYTMIIALVLVWVFFGMMTEGIFFAPRNMSNLFRQMSIIGFLACGMVLVLVTAGIDLSVGSVTGFVSVIVAYLQAYLLTEPIARMFPNLSIQGQAVIISAIAVLAGLLVGMAIGMWHGFAIAYLGIPAFIVTLGGLLIFRGGVLGITRGKTIVPIVEPFKAIAQEYVPNTLSWILAIIMIALILFMTNYGRQKKKQFGFPLGPVWKDYLKSVVISLLVVLYVMVMNDYRGIPIPVLLLIVIAAIIHYISRNTRFGRYVYALGGNREAAKLSGVDIRKNTFKVYALMGFMSGMSGIVLTGYVAAGTIGGGTNYELDAIASCVIGGVSLSGGSGSIVGALIGATFMASVVNGMSVMNMDVFWQNIIKGIILILAVYMDVSTKKRNG